MNNYTDKETGNLVNVSAGLATIISNPKQVSKESIEKILTSSKDFLYIPEISGMVKEVEDYYKQKYDPQLSLNFK